MPKIVPVSDLKSFSEQKERKEMIRSIRYTPEAIRDMDAVWDDVLEVSKSYEVADRYVTEFADMIAKKKQFPFSGTPLSYRGLFTGFYRVREGYIEVIRIIMSKQDYMTILFGSEED